MAKYTVEITDFVNDFHWWSGACDTIRDIQAADKEAEFNAHMEEMLSDGEWTDTNVNDYVWHDREAVYSAIGLNENGELPDINDEPLTLEVDGRGITEDEAQQLRDALYYGADANYAAAAGVDVGKYEGEIPNSVLNAIYSGVSFTEEDFACNAK